ncbi:hypothetical protein SAMN03097723_2224 [Pantoea eucalypti]|nr:hypothetical protein SAMN03097723_2224 [Pantoea eucalypti]
MIFLLIIIIDTKSLINRYFSKSCFHAFLVAIFHTQRLFHVDDIVRSWKNLYHFRKLFRKPLIIRHIIFHLSAEKARFLTIEHRFLRHVLYNFGVKI